MGQAFVKTAFKSSSVSAELGGNINLGSSLSFSF